MSSFAIREAKLREAIAGASSLSEQRRLNAQLTALRREASDQKAADREVDLAATVVRDTVTPVRVHDRHTAASDWLSEIEVPAGGDYPNKMRVEASLWFKKLHNAVKEDRDEFAEQAQGMADRLAGQFGTQAPAARQAFLDEVARLFRLADDRASDQEPDEEQSGNAESQVTDYDPETDQEPMWGEDWDGEDDTGSQIGSEQPSEQPGATARRRRYPKGSARGGGRTATRKSAIQTGTSDKHWYNEGYDKGEQFSREFGGDPYDAPDPLSGEFAGESIPEIFGSWDDATEDAMDAYEEGYWAAVAGEPRQASKKTAQAGWREEQSREFGSQWSFSARGGEVAATVFPGADGGYFYEAYSPETGILSGGPFNWDSEAKNAAESALGLSIGGAPTAKKQAAPPWAPQSGDRVTVNGQSGEVVEKSGMGRYVIRFDAGYTVSDIPRSDLKKASRRKRANEGNTCATCGDSIAQTDGDWHHDNGEKHDHEAKPSKESRRKTANVDVIIDGEYSFSAMTVPHAWARVVAQGLENANGEIVGGFTGSTSFAEAAEKYGTENEHVIVGQSRRRKTATHDLDVALELLTPEEKQEIVDTGVFPDDFGNRVESNGVMSEPHLYSDVLNHLRSFARRRTAGVYCNTHQVWVGDENKATHENCSKEQKATEKTKDARRKTAEQYVVVDTETEEIIDGPFNDLDEASEAMMVAGESYTSFEVPLAVAVDDDKWRRLSRFVKRAGDDDDEEVNEETNQFAEEVAEELSDGDDDSEPVDNEDADEVSSEDDDDDTEEKKARLRRFRAKVQRKLAESDPFGEPCPEEGCGLEKGHDGEHQDA